MAKDKVSLPSSAGGIMRFDESVGSIQISPGQVVILTLLISGLLIILRLLA